jgi:hypothetical protein
VKEEQDMAERDARLEIRDVARWANDRRFSKRIVRLEQENEQLKSENAALRKGFKEVRSLKVRRRGGGLVRTLLIGAAGCLVGMRLGRERYEQLAASVKERLSGSGEEDVLTVPSASEQGDPADRTVGALPTSAQ